MGRETREEEKGKMRKGLGKKDSPMLPMPRSTIHIRYPCSQPKLPFGDLDSCGLALRTVASSATADRAFYYIVSTCLMLLSLPGKMA